MTRLERRNIEIHFVFPDAVLTKRRQVFIYADRHGKEFFRDRQSKKVYLDTPTSVFLTRHPAGAKL